MLKLVSQNLLSMQKDKHKVENKITNTVHCIHTGKRKKKEGLGIRTYQNEYADLDLDQFMYVQYITWQKYRGDRGRERD